MAISLHLRATAQVTTRSRLSSAPHAPLDSTSVSMRLHANAHNALATALHYMRQPTANVHGAARKAAQALNALQHLASTEGGAA
ncbi:hypothetical protein [Variovorax paradoxus]|uniref:hypothetical protein n=1 Tax=Variovorax paradoxus TaxID=34073 RepID=UPI003D64D7F0